MHRDPTKIATNRLALPGVKSRPDLDVLGVQRPDQLRGAPNAARGPIEGCQETVARLLYLGASMVSQGPPDQVVVFLENGVSALITHLLRSPCRVHNVGEHHRGEDA